MPESSLAIVIVSYDVRADLARCLESLDGQVPPAAITVVDNRSSDGTLAWLAEHRPAVRAIDAGGNLGFSPVMPAKRCETKRMWYCWGMGSNSAPQ